MEKLDLIDKNEMIRYESFKNFIQKNHIKGKDDTGNNINNNDNDNNKDNNTN